MSDAKTLAAWHAEKRDALADAIKRFDSGELDNGIMFSIRAEQHDFYKRAVDLIEHLSAENAALRAELEVAESALLRKGYRKTCDISACNCGSQWNHGGHAAQRLSEIGEALRGAGFNGGTLLGNIETVCAERDALEAERAALRAEVEALRAVALSVLETNGGPIDGIDDDYVMVRRAAFDSLAAAIDAAKEQR